MAGTTPAPADRRRSWRRSDRAGDCSPPAAGRSTSRRAHPTAPSRSRKAWRLGRRSRALALVEVGDFLRRLGFGRPAATQHGGNDERDGDCGHREVAHRSLLVGCTRSFLSPPRGRRILFGVFRWTSRSAAPGPPADGARCGPAGTPSTSAPRPSPARTASASPPPPSGRPPPPGSSAADRGTSW